MSDQDEFAGSDKSDFSQKLSPTIQTPSSQKQISVSSLLSKQGFEPPRQLPKRSYSLQPDMATGWKPKKIGGSTLHNVFPINTSCQVIDYLVKQLYRKKNKQFEIAYLGPRKLNSFLLHEHRKYQNPYPLQKRLQPHMSQRPQMPLNPILQQKNLKFNSNFQCGNLDVAIFVSNHQYDLFMRVDTNTKGHTNWYYFTVQNGNFVGTVRFNIGNFRRQKSLYERVIFVSYFVQGLKPYYFSKRSSEIWKQGGQNVKYQKRPLRYNFLYEDQQYARILKTYITLSFTYHFDIPNDTVEFAYFIPYSYSRLLKFLPTLKNCKSLPPLKSLSGLGIPIIQVTDEQAEDYNKKVVIVTGRIHPGEANGSFVCQGFLEYICSNESKAKQFRKQFITYIIPMLNPDGVVAGNYRTSLFGKDLNRTFNSTRRYAFPQTFHLLQLVKDLKAKYKQRLNLFIDLHGHSVKKNIFMYGPQFNIQHPNYYVAKQLPKILASLTPCFRLFSCIFRISSQKSTTARATFNRILNIPFTYTMQSSNGFYYDSQVKKQVQLSSKKLKKVGVALADGILAFKQVEGNSLKAFVHSSIGNHTFSKRKQQLQENATTLQNREMLENNFSQESNNISSNAIKSCKNSQNQLQTNKLTIDPYHYHHQQQQQNHSDDNISEGNSDSQPQDEDLSQQQLQKILQTIEQGHNSNQLLDHGSNSNNFMGSSQKYPSLNGLLLGNIMTNQNQGLMKLAKLTSKTTGKQKSRYKKKNPLLPPINCLNRAMAKQKYHKSFIQQKAQMTVMNSSPQRQKRSKHLSISQMIEDARNTNGALAIFRKDQKFLANSILKKKASKMDLEKSKFFGSLLNVNLNGSSKN